MSAQTTYGYSTPKGFAGEIVDLAPHAVDTLLNEENTGVLKFGTGVVQGTTAGKQCKKPTSSTTADKFEGIATNNHTTELDMDGNIRVVKGAAVGVMRYGRIYALVASSVTPAYGDSLYLVISGADAGKFTNASASGTTVAVKGRFLGGKDATTGVAQVELFNQAQA